MVGGLATMIERVVIFAFFLIELKSVIEREYTLQTSFIKRDLTQDDAIYNLTRDNFDFAIRLDYVYKAVEP